MNFGYTHKNKIVLEEKKKILLEEKKKKKRRKNSAIFAIMHLKKLRVDGT